MRRQPIPLRAAAFAAVLLVPMSLKGGPFVYTYVGKPFDHFHGNYMCPPECSLSGFFIVADALPPNLRGIPIQNVFNVTPLAYVFTDGQVAATNSNSCPDFFTIWTDPSGNISAWVIRLFTPSNNAPCAGGGAYAGVQILTQKDLSGGTEDITIGAPAATDFAATVQDPGEWFVAQAVPEPRYEALVFIALLLLHIRKRCHWFLPHSPGVP
jgi:hypothetical protein